MHKVTRHLHGVKNIHTFYLQEGVGNISVDNVHSRARARAIDINIYQVAHFTAYQEPIRCHTKQIGRMMRR